MSRNGYRCRRCLVLMSILLAAHASAGEQWRSLFDGQHLDGWAQVGPGRFVVDDGALRSEGGMGLLWYTRERFGDMELHVSFKLGTPEANAGVFVRIPEPPTSPWDAVHRGYEVQIDERGDDHHRTGVLYSLTEALAHPTLTEWNHLSVVLDGDRTRVTVNGVLVTDYREGDPTAPRLYDYEPKRGPRPDVGYVGLQNHGEHDVVYFRDIRVRPLADADRSPPDEPTPVAAPDA